MYGSSGEMYMYVHFFFASTGIPIACLCMRMSTVLSLDSTVEAGTHFENLPVTLI